MRLILIGPPGSGKGTQGKLLSERLGLAHIGTGAILRKAIDLGTPVGRQVAPYVKNGRLVPDDLVNELVADLFRSDARPECFVLDGYPRTVAQAASFDQMLRQQFLDLQAALLFQVDDEEIVHRLGGRRVCPKCGAPYHVTMKPPRVPDVCDECGSRLVHRDDDRPETIRKRLADYHQRTENLIDYYRRAGLLREVPGIGDVEEIYARVVRALQPPPNGKAPS